MPKFYEIPLGIRLYVVALGPSDKKSVNVKNEQGGTFLIQLSIVNTGSATKMLSVIQLANSATEETLLLPLPELSLLYSGLYII